MAYTKTTWASKDIITASKLNHLEDGVAAASAAADDVNSSLEEESSKLSQKIQANVDNITQLSSRITTAENDIVGLNNDINDLENEDSTINDRIDNINIFTGNEANPATTSLTKKIDDLTSSTTASLSSQDTKLATLASQIAGLSTGSVNYKGAYTNGTSYVKNDIVSYSITSEGVTTITYYICISDNVIGTSGAPTEPDWQVFIMPTQLDGLVYYGTTEPGTDNEAQFWIKTKSNAPSTIDTTEIIVMTKDDINHIYVKDYAEKVYNVGDIVYHDDKLYICKTAITTAETWNSAHWAETLIANEFTNLANNIVKVSNTQPSDMFNKVWINSETESEEVPTYEEFQELESDVDELKSVLKVNVDEFDSFVNDLREYVITSDYESNSGSYWNGSGQLITNEQTTMMTAVKIDAIGRKSFSLSGQQINFNSTYAIRFVLDNGTVQSSTNYVTTDTVTDYVVNCPTNAKYLLVTYKNNTGVPFVAKVYEINTAVKTYIDNNDTSIKNEISLFEDQNYCSEYGWRNATISSSDGSETVPRNDRICTGFLSNVSSFVVKNNYYGLISYYKKDKTWISVTSFAKNFSVTQESFPSETYYVRVAMNNGTSNINVLEGVNCNIRFSSQGIQILKNQTDSTEESVEELLVKNKVELVKKTIHFMSREGIFYKPGTMNNLPYDCLVGIQNAYNHGYDSIRIDVRWTSDNVPILQHDATINAVAKNLDGTAISGDVSIDGHTLAELNEYDFGIRYGSEYAGMNITELDDALELCKQLGLECSLEIKPETITTTQYNSMIAAIVKSSMASHTYIRSHTHDLLTSIHTSAPGLNIEVSSSTTMTEANQLLDIDYAISLKNAFNKVRCGFAYTAGTTTFYDSVLTKAQVNGIELIAASVYNENDLLDIAVSKIPIIEVAFVENPYSVFVASLEE